VYAFSETETTGTVGELFDEFGRLECAERERDPAESSLFIRVFPEV